MKELKDVRKAMIENLERKTIRLQAKDENMDVPRVAQEVEKKIPIGEVMLVDEFLDKFVFVS